MLKGYLASKGVTISERHLRSVVPQVAPSQHQQRQQGQVDRTNPRLYHADYFGEKLHMDQNEKLVMYGVTYVLARDGYSGKIVAGTVMSYKNNLIVYDKVYREAVLTYGLWDEIRVDFGREYYLVLYVQEGLREQRGSSEIAPYKQTTSRQNHVIERIWVELNTRVTYPLKRAIASMDNRGIVDMQSDTTKFCVSTILGRLAEIN